jgi:transcriptional regulator with XRE-family HTH domain
LSQKKLASLSGLHRDFVGEIERGNANATLATFAALKRRLGVTVSELFRDIA